MRYRLFSSGQLVVIGMVLTVTCVGTIAATTTAAGPHPATDQQAAASAEAKKLKNPNPASPESIAAGQRIYQRFCRFCHGEDAKGNGPMAPEGTHPSNLVDEKWQRGTTDGEIFVTIRDGVGPKFDMKPYHGKITDQDMWNTVNYLRSLGPKGK